MDRSAHDAVAAHWGVASDANEVAALVPDDESASLEDRARGYLHVNCAHCHQPKGWSRPADEGLDLRYEVPFANTGISNKLGALRRNVQSGEMPFIGTTLKHSEGVELLVSYFNAL